MEAEAALVTARIRDFMSAQIREQYPWMKVEALENILNSQIEDLKTQIIAQEPAMQASKSRKNFFDLPAELRNEIYELALPTPNTIIKIIEWTGESAWPQLPALLQTSRQVRKEAGSIYYGTHTFSVTSSVALVRNGDQRLKEMLTKYLSAIGPESAGQIKRLEVASGGHNGPWWTPVWGWAIRAEVYEKLGLEELGVAKEKFFVEL